MRSVVVLPAPLGPNKPVIVPGASENEKSTATSVPKRFVSASPCTIGVQAVCRPSPPLRRVSDIGRRRAAAGQLQVVRTARRRIRPLERKQRCEDVLGAGVLASAPHPRARLLENCLRSRSQRKPVLPDGLQRRSARSALDASRREGRRVQMCVEADRGEGLAIDRVERAPRLFQIRPKATASAGSISNAKTRCSVPTLRSPRRLALPRGHPCRWPTDGSRRRRAQRSPDG